MNQMKNPFPEGWWVFPLMVMAFSLCCVLSLLVWRLG